MLEVQLEATRRELATTTLAIERQRYADQRETFEAMLRLLPAPAGAGGAGRGGGSDDAGREDP